MSDTMNYISIEEIIKYIPYFFGFITSAIVAFIDVLPDYSPFRIRRGLVWKLLFSVINGIICIVLLYCLWDKMFVEINPFFKGILFGVSYPTILKSTIILNNKVSPKDSISIDKWYSGLILFFRDLINNDELKYRVKKQSEIVTHCSIDELFDRCRHDITNDPDINDEQKNKLLSYITNIKNDAVDDKTKAEYLASFIIEKYPGDICDLSRGIS